MQKDLELAKLVLNLLIEMVVLVSLIKTLLF